MRPHRRIVAWIGVGALLVAGLVVLPPLRTRLVALSTVLEALGVRIPRPFAPEIDPIDTSLDDVSGRLWPRPAGTPAILIVPGATPEGTRDRRVNQVALALARADREVFVPDLDLYEERFTNADLQRIAGAVHALADRSGRPVTIAGFSYGGSFALVASADPGLVGEVERIAVMGAYFDLVGLVQAITTGTSLVDGEEIPWQGNPLARDYLYARVAGLLDEPARSDLVEALGGDGDPESLGSDARAVYELLANRDPRRTFELARSVPPRLDTILETFSPATIRQEIRVPVLAMHSTDDPLVPYGELRRLELGMPRADVITVSLFEHVDFDASSPRQWREVLPELAKVWTFATWLLDR